MNNTLNKLKKLFWTNYQPITLDLKSSEIVKDALAHYCAMCKTGFKSRHARDMHKKWKHDGKHPLKQNG